MPALPGALKGRTCDPLLYRRLLFPAGNARCTAQSFALVAATGVSLGGRKINALVANEAGGLLGQQQRQEAAGKQQPGIAPIELFVGKTDVLMAQHHWPIWGSDRIRDYLTKQRDLYKYVHDQTLRLINHGFTAPEIAEQLKLLGIASRSTFFKWRRERNPKLPRDTLERLSYLLGIYKALQILLPEARAADEWIRKPNSAAPFGGRPALERMLSGQVADLYVVRQYLDAERG